MRNIVPWIGGKSLLAKKIVSLFPEKINRYIEFFGGGASVLFYKDKHAPFEVYNDAASQLVNLFRCVKFHRSELQKEISTINSREVFEDIKALINIRGLTDIQRAAMFFIQTKISYVADRRSYGCNAKNLSPDYLEDIEIRLRSGKGVIIEHKDFENLISVYDRSNSLFYCDPPYHKTEKFYNVHFTNEDHMRLNASLKAIRTFYSLLQR